MKSLTGIIRSAQKRPVSSDEIGMVGQSGNKTSVVMIMVKFKVKILVLWLWKNWLNWMNPHLRPFRQLLTIVAKDVSELR